MASAAVVSVDDLAAQTAVLSAPFPTASMPGLAAGHLKVWDEARLAGYRGCCSLMLDRPGEAATILVEAVRRTPANQVLQRAALLNEVANAYARQGEVDLASGTLMEALALAGPAGVTERLRRAREIRSRLDRWNGSLALRELDDRLAAT
jgi:hypothetical protein